MLASCMLPLELLVLSKLAMVPFHFKACLCRVVATSIVALQAAIGFQGWPWCDVWLMNVHSVDPTKR